MTERVILCLCQPNGIMDCAGFSKSRLEKICRAGTANGKIQQICAERALIAALEKGLGLKPPIEYAYLENGKPYMKDPAHGYISISHAGVAGACAWSAAPVGVDMELTNRDVSKLSRKILSAGDAPARLIDAWCVKESYVKLTGEGLSLPFTEISARDGFIRDL